MHFAVVVSVYLFVNKVSLLSLSNNNLDTKLFVKHLLYTLYILRIFSNFWYVVIKLIIRRS